MDFYCFNKTAIVDAKREGIDDLKGTIILCAYSEQLLLSCVYMSIGSEAD